jgi:hypothetical protein
MGIFGKRIVKKDGSETNVKASTRAEILDEIGAELEETGNEIIVDLTNGIAMDGGFDMDNVKYIPYIKKYMIKISNLVNMFGKSMKIEIEHTEALEKEISKMNENFASMNNYLSRIALALEKQNIENNCTLVDKTKKEK